jgi:hypothetical protein
MALVLGACFAPSYPTGIPCSELGTCPPGQLCFEGICQPEPGLVDPDAMPGQPDAMPGQPDAMPGQPDAMPVACTTPAECDDGLACTSDTCEGDRCVHTADDSACADDDIACTTSRCDLAQGCVLVPDDSACSDGVGCTTDRCDRTQGCVLVPDDSACSDGVGCTTDRCDRTQGCVATPDDAVCNDGISCTTDRCTLDDCVNAASDAACNDGDTCTADSCDVTNDCVNGELPLCSRQCLAVLIYNDSPDNNLASRAAAALGMTANVTRDGSGFAAAFDASEFDLIILDSPGTDIPDGVTSRLTSWIEGGGKVVSSHWNLNNNPALQAALGVNVVTSINAAPPVHAVPDSPVDLFRLADVIPSPLVFGDFAGDNGDVISVAGDGFVAARFGSPTSAEAAMVVTRNDRVIVMGFLPWDLFNAALDADADGTNDGEELYRNQMRFLCAGL